MICNCPIAYCVNVFLEIAKGILTWLAWKVRCHPQIRKVLFWVTGEHLKCYYPCTAEKVMDQVLTLAAQPDLTRRVEDNSLKTVHQVTSRLAKDAWLLGLWDGRFYSGVRCEAHCQMALNTQATLPALFSLCHSWVDRTRGVVVQRH